MQHHSLLPIRPAGLFIILMAFFSCKKETIINQSLIAETASTYNFIKFWFDTAQNPLYLNSTISMTIDGNSITGRVPYYTNITSLIPSFEMNGVSVTVNDSVQTSGGNAQNFKKVVYYNVVGEDGTKSTYAINLTNFTGLPVINIKTADGIAITSKDDYVTGTISIDGAGIYDDLSETSMKIKGRGNSTWGQPKNPYKMKFDNKTAILGEAKAKTWVLLANYFDNTMLRNGTAWFMGRLSNLDWTPGSHFAEVFLNNVFIGCYQITDQVEEGSNRVNVGDDGYLVEVDQLSRLDADDIYFQTSRILCSIKAPDVTEGDEQYTYIKNYVTAAENALYADNFTDPEEGYAKYLDVTSFVDWYLINEIARNTDAAFVSSCYMNLIPGGKLKMGPIWDFDIAFGNVNYNTNYSPEGWYINGGLWLERLWKDPAFIAKLKTRLAYFKSEENTILGYINNTATSLNYSVIENNNKYQTLYTYTWPNYAILGSYDNEVLYLKTWLHSRLAWMETALDTL